MGKKSEYTAELSSIFIISDRLEFVIIIAFKYFWNMVKFHNCKSNVRHTVFMSYKTLHLGRHTLILEKKI